jgi:hypothetical protein
LLFIDGDHRYEGVRRDFEMYSPLVGAGGLIAFHDNPGEDWGVGQWGGIGVLFAPARRARRGA